MVLYFMLTVIPLVLLIAANRAWPIGRKALAVAGLALIAFIAYFFVLPGSEIIEKGAVGPIWSRTPYKEILLFAAMLFGMSAKYFWDIIEIRKKRNKSLKQGEMKKSLDFDFWDFAQPLLVSALVFSGILGTVKEIQPASFIFSFQNGFFWQTLLKRKL